jgi:hypothetical protein
MSRTVINWVVVGLIAAVITVLQVLAGPVIAILLIAVRVLILAALVYFLYTLWRTNRARLSYLDRRQKLLFYGAGALLILVVFGSFLLSWTLLTTLMFFAIIGGCAFVMWRVYQDTAGWY